MTVKARDDELAWFAGYLANVRKAVVGIPFTALQSGPFSLLFSEELKEIQTDP
jgi:hypothetical protein